MTDTPTLDYDIAPTAPILQRLGYLGISGARRANAAHRIALSLLAAAVAPRPVVFAVGAAPADEQGVDAAARGLLQHLGRDVRIFAADWQPGTPSSTVAQRLVDRSTQLAQWVATARGHLSLLAIFPDELCDRRLQPGVRWQSCTPKSGTWSTALLAAGLGAPVLAFVGALDGPTDLRVPEWRGGCWFRAGKGWQLWLPNSHREG